MLTGLVHDQRHVERHGHRLPLSGPDDCFPLNLLACGRPVDGFSDQVPVSSKPRSSSRPREARCDMLSIWDAASSTHSMIPWTVVSIITVMAGCHCQPFSSIAARHSSARSTISRPRRQSDDSCRPWPSTIAFDLRHAPRIGQAFGLGVVAELLLAGRRFVRLTHPAKTRKETFRNSCPIPSCRCTSSTSLIASTSHCHHRPTTQNSRDGRDLWIRF